MKNEKKEMFITEISLEDFKKLNLTGYQQMKHYYKIERVSDGNGGEMITPEVEVDYEQTGEIVKDSQGTPHWVSHKDIFTKLQWDKVDLNQVVDELIAKSKECDFTNPICIAIHEIHDNKNEEISMCESSYLDKYLTPMGMQTFLAIIDVSHLYSRRNYFYIDYDYFQIDKRVTKAIYLIHWN